MSAKPDIVTAAVLVIGDEILSGRTKDKNIGYIADYLTAIGIDLKEVRVVPDDEAEIVEALNALRRDTLTCSPPAASGRRTTTSRPMRRQGVRRAARIRIREAVAMMKERLAKTGGEFNEARLRMARIPRGATLVANKVSGAPGFWIGNVIVDGGHAGGDAGHAGRGGAEIEDRRRDCCRRRSAPMPRKATSAPNSAPSPRRIRRRSSAAIRLSTKRGPNTNIVVRSRDADKLAVGESRGRSAC